MGWQAAFPRTSGGTGGECPRMGREFMMKIADFLRDLIAVLLGWNSNQLELKPIPVRVRRR